jgi:ribosome biogenesis GTPase
MNKGLVLKSTGSWYTVKGSDCIIQCRIKGKFRTKDIATTNPVTVGDRVQFEMADDGTGVITDIDERKNYIIRRSTRFHKEAHLLGANIDQAFLMVCLKLPATPREFIDRFLLTAEAYHIPSTVLINKIDILDSEDKSLLDEFINTYTLAGYTCIEMSIPTNKNVQEVYELMKGKLNLIAGNSGVGKTTLINAINPSLELKTSEISDYHQAGKHTTTFSEIFSLDDNTYVIDSPGIKGFGIIDINKEEVGLFFPEIFRISKGCKFYNCTHLHEPGCAVVKAVEVGEIGESRFRSYCNIMLDKGSKYR